jgi:two-component system, OmpR family, KDP operon response regulator KdpE
LQYLERQCTIDLVTRKVTPDGRHVTLARQEYRLLQLLASHLGLVITHSQLILDIWGNESPNHVPYLRTLVRKLETESSEPKLLISESGVG